MICDEEYLKLIEEYDIKFKPNDVIEGVVVGYEGNDVLVDINAKTNAICPIQEVLISKEENIKNVLKQGEKYSFVILAPQNEDGIFYISNRKVALKQNIAILEEKLANNEIVTGKITNLTKGGALVNVLGIKGFIPTSQFKNQVSVGQELELKILSIDVEANNFIFSSKKIYEDEIELVKKDTLEKIELNMVVKGNVVRLTDFGAFVDIGGIDGLLPLSQMSWSWIDKPSDMLKLGETIEVEIIGIDTEKQRISLSLKSLVENPWEKASEVVQEKEIMKGKITAIKPFGAFVEICPKIEGLISKAQIKEYFKKYQRNLEIDDEIEVLIRRFDAQKQKINLEIV